MEKLWTQENSTKLLLLVKVSDEDNIFGGKGSDINHCQNLERTTISGKQYYRMKCTIDEGNYNMLVHGKSSKMYTHDRFVSDYKNKRGTIRVTFDDTKSTSHPKGISHSFLWNNIINHSSTFMILVLLFLKHVPLTTSSEQRIRFLQYTIVCCATTKIFMATQLHHWNYTMPIYIGGQQSYRSNLKRQSEEKRIIMVVYSRKKKSSTFSQESMIVFKKVSSLYLRSSRITHAQY